MEDNFTLRYLPLFNKEITTARDYIAKTLENPLAAMRLVEDTEKAIFKRLANPLSFKPYHSKKYRKHPYYCIYVKNYVVFYVVIGNVMEVRRFIHSKRDLENLV